MLDRVRSLCVFLKQIKARFLGLGLLIAWVYGTWFSDAVFSSGGAQGLNVLRVSLAFSALGLLGLAFRPGRRVPLRPSFVAASALIVSATTLLFPLASGDGLLAVASALGGLASSVLWIAWGELFCQIDQELAESCIPASLVVFAIAALVVCLFPDAISRILVALYPLASCLMLLLGKNEQSDSFVFPEAKKPLSHVLPSLLGLAFCSMVCSVATGFAVVGCGAQSFPIFGGGVILVYAFGGVVAGCIAALAISHANRLSFSFLYDLVIPLIVFFLSLGAFAEGWCETLALVLACTAALFSEALFYAIFARITVKGLCLPSEIFGIFRAMVQLGFLLGGLLGACAGADGSLFVGLALICACVVVSPFFLRLQKRFEEPPESPSGVCSAGLAQERDDNPLSRIVADFKLSARESEVLGYLGRGRSVPYMREVMTLSKSTIETHIKHIYAKTGVHSKQELIDLIEKYQDA